MIIQLLCSITPIAPSTACHSIATKLGYVWQCFATPSIALDESYRSSLQTGGEVMPPLNFQESVPNRFYCEIDRK